VPRGTTLKEMVKIDSYYKNFSVQIPQIFCLALVYVQCLHLRLVSMCLGNIGTTQNKLDCVARGMMCGGDCLQTAGVRIVHGVLCCTFGLLILFSNE
jgi:hypothetical protein